MAYRGEIPTTESTQLEEAQPAFYVLRARSYQTGRGNYNTDTVTDLQIEKFDTKEAAQKFIENMAKQAKQNYVKSAEDTVLLYGYLAKPKVEVKTEVIHHVSTTFEGV